MEKAIKIIMILLAAAMLCGMGWFDADEIDDILNPDPPVTKPEPKPEPPIVEPSPSVKQLTGHVWENSDSRAGQSYVMLPADLNATSVSVARNHFVFDSTWHDGRSLWYGPVIKARATIRVKTPTAVYEATQDAPPAVDPVVTKPDPKPSEKWTETCRYHGRYNGDRPTWYCGKRFERYPRTLTVEIPGCVKRTIRHNGSRFDNNGLLLKQSDVSGRGLAIIFSASCKGKSAGLIY